MCGFGGLLNNSFAVQRQQIADIAKMVAFRGPDSTGIRILDDEMKLIRSGNNAIFFNRLAILDLDKRSDQPFENDRFLLLFNGEIYNYAELKQKLISKGCSFQTTSDTEVLFFALEIWGIHALKLLNGMFAFCWIDKVEKKFLLARDRMGIKPLYYCQKNKSFSFASELNSVLRFTSGHHQISRDSVRDFLWTQFTLTPNTIIKDVYKLPPGHYLEGSLHELNKKKQLVTKPFWDAFDIADKRLEMDHSPETLKSILIDSLSRQLIADVPLGVFLSSGIDSSLLAALINKYFAKDKEFNFFTISFNQETNSDESVEARNYIQGFNNSFLKSHTLKIDPDFVGDRLENIYAYFDEPFGDHASLLNWAISQKAREHVTVALSGDGADELFWGYNRYQQWREPSLQFGESLKNFKLPAQLGNLIKPIILNKYLNAKIALELEEDLISRHFTLFLPPVMYHLMTDPIWKQSIWAMSGIEKIKNRPDMTSWLDIKTYLADAMLYKVDRASMAASLEVRVPYLDNKVVDHALSMPLIQKSNARFKYKSNLKQLLQELAPHYNVNLPKKGFNFPLDQWLRIKWKDRVLSVVNKQVLSSLQLDETLYLNMVRKYYAGNKRYCLPVWYIFNLLLWQKKFENIVPLQQS